MKKITINNGEKVTNQGLTVFDAKNQPITTIPPGASVAYEASPGGEQIAQFVQDSPGSLQGTITTEGDQVGVVTFTGRYTREDGTVLLDSEGNIPQLEVTVVNSIASTADFGTGTVEPE